MFEVTEFCAALANTNNPEPDSNTRFILTDNVRTEVLSLLWEILSHPEASSLKPYDHIKSYVTNELRVEPMGKIHRQKFLESCKAALTKNATDAVVDEAVALGIVKLTLFVLEACPREDAIGFVTEGGGMLMDLLVRELTAYLKRRASAPADLKKVSILLFLYYFLTIL